MTERKYIRDGRAPVPVDPRVSAVMSRIQSKNTGPEKAMRAALSEAGIRGFRLQYAKAPGRPDITFVGRKVAVFIHGCFWHSCPHCQPRRPKTHKKFWTEKLDRNIARDKRNVRALRKAGWSGITVWDCRLKKYPVAQVRRVHRALAKPPM